MLQSFVMCLLLRDLVLTESRQCLEVRCRRELGSEMDLPLIAFHPGNSQHLSLKLKTNRKLVLLFNKNERLVCQSRVESSVLSSMAR